MFNGNELGNYLVCRFLVVAIPLGVAALVVAGLVGYYLGK
jgi:hypothetical protein